jgi:hypothetical protein
MRYWPKWRPKWKPGALGLTPGACRRVRITLEGE